MIEVDTQVFDIAVDNSKRVMTPSPPIDKAAFVVLQFILRPKGEKTAYYARKFNRYIEQAHEENPLATRALLSRMAVAHVASGTFPDAEQPEIDAARRLLEREEIVLTRT